MALNKYELLQEFVALNCCVKEFHMSAEDILETKGILISCVANYYEEPVVITKAKAPMSKT